MSKDTADPASPGESTPAGYQRTTGGKGFRWEPPTPQRLAELLSGYEIECMLGRGGMGAVYKGKQKSLDRTVAIKILPPGLEEEDPSYIDRFKNEARVMAKFMHPGIVAVHDFGETSEGQLYIVMEFVDGTDVQQMIASQGRLPPDHALAITAHVCDALKYAHEHGVIHRDIKPANILINREGAVKVADFGLAKAEEAGSSGFTKTGMAMGTPDYVAPEALMPGAQVDGRADLYAVGVMLYQMLTGQIPRGAWQPASVLSPGTDRRFDQIITKAMQYDREARYQSSGEIRQDLDAILSAPQAPSRPPGQAAAPQQSLPQKPTGRPPQKRPEAAAAAKPQMPGKDIAATPAKSKTPLFIGLGVAAALGIGAFFLWEGRKPASPATPAIASSTPALSVSPTPSPPASTSSSSPSRFPLPLPTRPSEAGQVLVWRRTGEPIDPADPITQIPAGMDDVVQVAFADGGNIVLALHRNGRVTSWGKKELLEGMSAATGDVVHLVGARSRTAFALRSDGSVLILGKEAGKWSKPVSAASSFASLSTDDDGHSGAVLGLQRDGTVFCWAVEDDAMARLIQQIPKNLNHVTSIGFGDTYACALRDDGILVTWGRDAPKDNLPKPVTSTATVHAVCHPSHGGYVVESNGRTTEWGSLRTASLETNKLNIQGLTNLSSQYGFAAFQDAAKKWYFVGGKEGPNVPNISFCERMAKNAIQIVIGPKYILAIKPVEKMQPVAMMQGSGAADTNSPPVVFGTKRYKLYAEHLDWHAAKTKCAAQKGRLAEVRSKEENDFLLKLAAGRAVDGLWLGATDEAREGRWIWSDGSPVSYSNWDTGQPNNSGSEGENYAMLLTTREPGKWWDQPEVSGRGLPGNWRTGYVCEWDEKPNVSTAPATAVKQPTPPLVAAASSPPPVPMKPPETAAPQAALPPELTELQKRMDGLTTERVTAPFEAGVKQLNTSYISALNRELPRHQKAGDLDAVLALNSEKKRAAASEPLLGDDSTDPAVLKPLRNTYRAAMDKLDTARMENQKTLTEQYDSALKKLETDLTKQNRISDAAAVRSVREALDKSATSDAPPSPADSKPVAAMPPPAATPKNDKPGKYQPNLPPAEPIPAALTEPPPRPLYTRQLADWALSQNDGEIVIRIGQQPLTLTHQRNDKVPSDKFELLKIIVRNVIADKVDINPEWLLGQTDLEEIQLKGTKFADFSVLRGMTKLKQLLILEGGDEELIKACTEARAPGTFRQLPLLPAVTKLQMSAALDDEDIRCISERLSALQELRIHKPRQITTLVPLQRLASLERLEMRDNNSVISHLKDLAPLPALETLILGGMSGAPVADWESVSTLADLHDLQIHQASLSSGSLTALKLNQFLKLERLVLEYNVGMGGDASVIGTLPKLMRLHLAGNGANKAKTFYQFVMSLPPQPSLEEFLCSDIREWTDADWEAFATRFQGLHGLELRACSALTDRAVQSFAEKMPQLTRLHIYDTPVTDAVAVPLRSMRKLEDLMIGGPNLTPVILVELRKLKKLKKLFILTHKLPQSAINDFKKARPDVEVIVEVKP
ncbi:protein kinase domain-containing protein [Prosthecobacter sp.]|uniref:protein kinase domain-containing protein n=1 Tax=Prosthecobacter sp. TaxID=1965333 RepID=UPI003782D4CD